MLFFVLLLRLAGIVGKGNDISQFDARQLPQLKQVKELIDNGFFRNGIYAARPAVVAEGHFPARRIVLDEIGEICPRVAGRGIERVEKAERQPIVREQCQQRAQALFLCRLGEAQLGKPAFFHQRHARESGHLGFKGSGIGEIGKLGHGATNTRYKALVFMPLQG